MAVLGVFLLHIALKRIYRTKRRSGYATAPSTVHLSLWHLRSGLWIVSLLAPPAENKKTLQAPQPARSSNRSHSNHGTIIIPCIACSLCCYLYSMSITIANDPHRFDLSNGVVASGWAYRAPQRCGSAIVRIEFLRSAALANSRPLLLFMRLTFRPVNCSHSYSALPLISILCLM